MRTTAPRAAKNQMRPRRVVNGSSILGVVCVSRSGASLSFEMPASPFSNEGGGDINDEVTPAPLRWSENASFAW